MSKDDGNKPGTGVDPNKVCVPVKRLKNAHRKARKAGRVSLKEFIAGIEDDELQLFGEQWLANKKPSATAAGRKAHRSRIVSLRVSKAPTEGKKKKK
jgi:hypothetical protein